MQFEQTANHLPLTNPLYNWPTSRASGLLLHPTSLPSDGGVGCFDETVGEFLEFLADARLTYWQICPLGPTGYGDSPYQCSSAFAGNPYLIDLKGLSQRGLIHPEELDLLSGLSRSSVDFGALYRLKVPLLMKAYERFAANRSLTPYGDFDQFRQRQNYWLPDFAYYQSLKTHFKGRPWWEWPAEVKYCDVARRSPLRRELARETEAVEFIQYLFFGQWKRVRDQAKKAGITIIGDTPIYVPRDSADTWSHPDLFQLDRDTALPPAVAGVPPDRFSSDSQLWGNLLYDWPVHAANGYDWWIARLRSDFALYDVVRLDHFRGFDTYWSIPYGAISARIGEWKEGPGIGFFNKIASEIPSAKLIAEDLGGLSPSAINLRVATGLPGMNVLQFAFNGADNPYLPCNYHPNSVVYPGNHDTDTTVGWYGSTDQTTRANVRKYLGAEPLDICKEMIRLAYASVSRIAIVSMQDVLRLGSETRFNRPGTFGGNWNWRLRKEQLDEARRLEAGGLRELAETYNRLV